MTGQRPKDFLGKPAPYGYVAGLGRGATGFMTRPDLGPGRDLATLTPHSKASPSSSHATQRREEGEGDDEREDASLLEMENEEGLLAARGPLGADDEEADAIFAKIDAKMSERRRRRQTSSNKSAKSPADALSVTRLFADAKMELRRVSAAEWAQLPAAGSFVAKRMKRTNERERYTPLPDSVLLGGAALAEGAGYGREEVTTGTETDFRSAGETRGRVLGSRLDMASGGTTTPASIDPLGYITSLDSLPLRSTSEVNDIRRARTLLKNAVSSNPHNGPAWIAAARIEEVALNMKQARRIIKQALEMCPDQEDLWLEAVRLCPPEEGPELLATALEGLSRSAKLWLKAVEMEKDNEAAKRLLRRALEAIPESAVLWKMLVEREEDTEDARVLLAKAVECVPTNIDLWIALARLESHENARRVLNRARQNNPLSVAIWLAAARLEEAQGNREGIVERIVGRAVSELTQRGVMVDREGWLKEAASCEQSGDLACAQAIVHSTAMLGLDEQAVDLKMIWLDDVESCVVAGAPLTARSLMNIALQKFPTDEELWLRAVTLESKHVSKMEEGEGRAQTDKVKVDLVGEHFVFTNKTIEALLAKAVEACPHSEQLWLRYAEFEAKGGEIPMARSVLARAFALNPGAVQIWRAAAKLEADVGEYERARLILQRAREQTSSELLWRYSIKLDRRLGNVEAAISLAEQAVQLFPTCAKLWLLLGELRPALWDRALEQCPRSPDLWVAASQAVMTVAPIQARALLERARLCLPNEPSIWLASAALEKDLGEVAQAQVLLARALQKCPTSGQLWCMAIDLEPRSLRKAKAMEALRRCGPEALIYLAIARIMTMERQLASAKEYYERATALNQQLGDAWAAHFLFLKQYGQAGEAEKIFQAASIASPKEGPHWRPFRKQDRWWRASFAEIFTAFIETLRDKATPMGLV